MRFLTTLVLGTTLLSACTSPRRPYDADPATEAGQVRAIIRRQLGRYPSQGAEDLYKLLHQAAMGSEHAMTDTAAVRAWMVNELATMQPGPPEPLIDTIAPGGAIVRVNLRPWIAAHRSTDSLLAAFIATAKA